MLSLAIFVASIVALQADTLVVIGMAERDLTGDGQPELLRLVGVGRSIDSLDVTLSIESGGRTVYRARLAPITRTVGFDRSRRKLSRAQHREQLAEFGKWFFAAANFKRPQEFVKSWREQAPGRLAEIPNVIARDRKASTTVLRLNNEGRPPQLNSNRVRPLTKSLLDNAMNRRDFITRTGLAAVGGSHLGAQGVRWQSDGAATLARLGVLTPDFDPTPESEMWAMTPAGVSIHSARVPRGRRDPKAFAEPPHVDLATDQLVELAPRAILFAYTSSSYALGAEGEIAVRDRLEQRAQGIPIILTCRAATSALHLLGVRRVSLIHPPWFSESVNEQGKTYFREQGFDVVQCTCLLPARASEVEIAPAELFDFVTSHTPRTAEAVFIGGNGMRAVGAISALESRFGIPVLSANQVVLYDALRSLGQAHAVRSYGKIFEYGGGPAQSSRSQ